FLQLDYPAQLLAEGPKLYVADLFGDRVLLLEPALTSPAKAPDSASSGPRTNLLRRPGVFAAGESRRCLLCHDGALHDGIDRFIPGKINHPLKESKVSCVSCHEP